MFHQVRICQKDCSAQRFIWWGTNRDEDPDTYEMTMMTFGSTCSPCCAQEVKNRNSREFNESYPKAASAIIKRHFVDDYLDSEDTVEESIQLIQEVIKVHSYGGFEIFNWSSNSKEVLESIPVELRAKERKDLSLLSELPTERILGLQWNMDKDIFCFELKFSKIKKEILDGSRQPTKREVLKVVMSVFDPLGFLSNLMIKTKILLQDIWKSDIGWDDELPASLFERWLT